MIEKTTFNKNIPYRHTKNGLYHRIICHDKKCELNCGFREMHKLLDSKETSKEMKKVSK